MFRYHKGNSREEVAALFGGAVQLINMSYVENGDTGDLLANAGRLGRDEEGRIYLLRWRGRSLGLHATVAHQEDDHGTYPLFTLKDLGTSVYAVNMTRVARVDLTPDEAAEAMRVAAEACVVYESYRGDFGSRARVSAPDASGRELSPGDFGYPEIARGPLGIR